MSAPARTVAVITGSRAEFGLLWSVIRALRKRRNVKLEVIAGGEHDPLLAGTASEVMDAVDGAQFIGFDDVVAGIQELGIAPAASTAIALGVENTMGARLGIEVVRYAMHLSELRPDFVLVLGDRIEAFAAAAAAAVSGIRVAHMHGGDRAEGIADESLRHATSKLAHLHLPATETSAQRLIAMGEDPARVHVVGSPAIDDVADTRPLSDAEFAALGAPSLVVLLHPTGEPDDIEHARAARLLACCARIAPALALHPNHDPGRSGIMRAMEESGLPHRAHLPRAKFLGLLRRARALVGNSSAGLIEAAAIPIWCVNVGRRQSGRERAANVIDIENWDYQTIESAISRALRQPIGRIEHPFGDGRTGERVAHLLASISPNAAPLRKQNSY